MQSKHLDVRRVLMVVDPTSSHWELALCLTGALSEHGVKTTLACVSPLTPGAKAKALAIPEIDLRVGIDQDSAEWTLFAEMQVEPDLVQVFEPEHVLMPWRSPTVLHVPDSVLLHADRALMDACGKANLIIVEDEARFDKLQALVGVGPFVAVLRSDKNCGWNYYLAYQEIVQALRLDLGEQTAGRFELI